ncbi:type II secretion system GspH family protein [Patescibacteria group bacterium]|nr:type II secretion system GspH family protein [Patescibacteria group bacterium]
MKRSGFTIVELLVVLVIITILLVVGIPRYNALIHQQDTTAAAQQLLECMQNAQQEAGAPSTLSNNSLNLNMAFRYAEADITGGKGMPLTCTVNHLSEGYNSVDSVPPAALTVNGLALCSITATQYNLNATGRDLSTMTGSEVKLTFDTRAHGTVNRIFASDGATSTILTSTTFGQGLKVDLVVADTFADCGGSDNLTIAIPPIGIPISLN